MNFARLSTATSMMNMIVQKLSGWPFELGSKTLHQTLLRTSKQPIKNTPLTDFEQSFAQTFAQMF
jgi:hypothetical protein